MKLSEYIMSRYVAVYLYVVVCLSDAGGDEIKIFETKQEAIEYVNYKSTQDCYYLLMYQKDKVIFEYDFRVGTTITQHQETVDVKEHQNS